MAFVVAQNKKSLRLIKQKQKHNVNTTNDKDIVLNFLEELSISSFDKKNRFGYEDDRESNERKIQLDSRL